MVAPSADARDEAEKHIYLYQNADGYGSNGLFPLSVGEEAAVWIAGDGVSGSVGVSLYRADEATLLRFLTYGDKDGSLLRKYALSDTTGLSKATSFDVSIEMKERTRVLLPAHERGVWLVRAEQGAVVSEAIIVVSDLAAIAKEGDGELVFWVQGMRDGRSVEGADVSLYNLRGREERLDNARTDGSGIAKTRITSDADIAVVGKDGDRSVIPINLSSLNYRWASFVEKKVATKYFTYTDRPLYHPEDIVHFKSILRDDDDARYSVPGGSATVSVYTGWGEERKVIYEKSHNLSGFGAVDGTIVLPADAGPGEYSLQISRSPDERNGWADSLAYFTVAEFRKPEYELSLSSEREMYVAGDEMRFVVEGKYFSGQPVLNEEVKYEVRSSSFYEYEYGSGKEYALDNRYRYGAWYGEIVQSGTVVLDGNGRAEVSLVTAIPESKKGKNQVFSFEVNMDVGGGEPVFDRKNAIVYAGDYGIYRKGYSRGGRVGEKISVPMALIPYRDGVMVSGIPIRVSGERTYWEEVRETESVPFHYVSGSESVSEFGMTSSSDGSFAVEFVPERPGSYRFVVQSDDVRGNAVSREVWVWVSERDGFYYSFGDDGADRGVTVEIDKEAYEPGENVDLTLSSSLPGRDVFVSIERGRMDRFFVVRMNGKSMRYPVRLGEEDMPDVYAAVSSFANGKFLRDEVKVPVSAERKRIDLRVVPDQEGYGPGDDISFTVETTDRNGKPVQADVSLSVVDKALFELTDRNLEDIFESFYRERYNDTQDAHSLQGIVMYGAERGGCFAAGTDILLADGSTKPIEEVRVGDIVLTRTGQVDSSLVSAAVSAVHVVEVSGVLVINGALRVTPEHRLFSDGEWRAAGDLQIGNGLIRPDGTVETVDTIEWIRGSHQVYNLTIEGAHTYFAGGVWVHNSKDGGGRSVFRDTAYWNPSIRTGADGKAQVTFRLPDNLTTWAFASYAVTEDTMVGQTTGEVVVTKSVILRPTVPDRLRIGDRAIIGALLQNFSGETGTFSVSLDFDAGRIEEGADQDLTLGPNESREVFFTVVPERETERATLVFAADGGDEDRSDSVTLPLPITHAGYWIGRSAVGSGTDPATYSFGPGSDSGRSVLGISIAPSLLGALPDSMRYLVDYPYGCMEQTMSRLMPSIVARNHPELFRAALEDKDMGEILAEGVRRLDDHQLDNGGFPWWWHDGADPFISWYVAENISEMIDAPELPAAERVVAREILAGLRSYVSGNRIMWPDRAFVGKDEAGRNVLIREREALRLMLLANLDIARQQITDFDGMRPDILALAVRHNLRNGYHDSGRDGLDRLLSEMKEDGSGGVFWEAGPPSRFGSREASTALAIDAILLAGDPTDKAERAVRFLNTERRRSYWANTFATAQVMRAIAAFSERHGGAKPDYSYEILAGGKPVAQGVVRDLNAQVRSRIPLSDLPGDSGAVEVRTTGNGEAFLTVTTEEFHEGGGFVGESNGLSVSRAYLPEDGKRDIGIGDVIRVRLTVENRSDVSDYLVVHDQLPAALVAIDRSFKNTQGIGQSADEPYGVEIEGGTVTFSVVSMPEGVRIYEYPARVVSAGDYFVPPARVEMMYRPEISGLSASERLSISVKSHPSERSTAAGVGTMIPWHKVVAGVIAVILMVVSAVLVIWARIMRKRRTTVGEITDDRTNE